MPSKYRSRTEIIAEILQAANGYDNASKTRIMFNAYLTHTQLKEYLTLLIQSGLLEYHEVTHTYKTTEKGLKFLKKYEQMEELTTTNTKTKLL